MSSKTDNTRKDIHTSGIPVLCSSCEARHSGVCGALTPEQLTMLAKAASKYEVATGKELIGDSVREDHYSNILSGVVKLTKSLPDGRQQIVGLQFAPDFLGRPFQAESKIAAEAVTDVELCTFRRQTIERLMAEQPDLQHRLLQQTMKELDEARNWMVALGRKTAAEKIASFLVMIARNIDPLADTKQGAVSFQLPLSRGDIADFLGLTLETVSRHITQLRREGVIHVENRRVTVRDFNKLITHSGDGEAVS